MLWPEADDIWPPIEAELTPACPAQIPEIPGEWTITGFATEPQGRITPSCLLFGLVAIT